jgi:hypothetical protein
MPPNVYARILFPSAFVKGLGRIPAENAGLCPRIGSADREAVDADRRVL